MSRRNDAVDARSYGEIGHRIHVMGNSCSGKSTLGAELASALGVPFVELDALNWRPGWVGLNATDPQEFERLIAQETCGDEWVVAGSYTRFSQQVFWPRLQTIIWLDLPLYQLVWRMLRRSWKRWRSIKGIALGHQLRRVLAPAEGLEQGGFAAVVDRLAAGAQAPSDADLPF